MQSNASELIQDRKQRLDAVDVQEESNRVRDERVRSDKARFVSGLHRQREDIGLGESLRRGGGRGFVESEA